MTSHNLHIVEDIVDVVPEAVPVADALVLDWHALNPVERAYYDTYREFVRTSLHHGGVVLNQDINPEPIVQSSSALEPYTFPS